MKRMLRIAAGIALVVTISACDLLFSGKNLFAGLDGPNTDELKQATGSSLIDLLNESKGGDNGELGQSFFDKIVADGVADDIVANLELIYSSGVTDAQGAEAALLAADVILGTTESGAVVNGIVCAVMNAASMEPELILSSVLEGNPAASDPLSFMAFMDDMVSVANAYDALGTAYQTDGELVPIDLADGQTAVVSIIFSTVLDVVDTTNFLTDYPEYAYIDDPQQQASIILFTEVIDVTNTGGTVDLAAVFGSADAASVAFDDLLNIDSDGNPDNGVEVVPSDSPFSALLYYSGASTLAEMMQ